MKNFLFLIMIAIAGVLSPVMAQDAKTTDVSSLSAVLYSEEMTVEPGNQIVLPIYMKNSEPVTLFQTNVYLPEGFSFAKKSNGKYAVSLVRGRLTDEDDNHVISSNIQPDGSLLILCASQDNYTFDGNDGKVATVTINVSENVQGGQYLIKLNNQKLVRPDNNGDNIAEYQVVITVPGNDDAATTEANLFKNDHAYILGKSLDDITVDDKAAIYKALEDYDKLSNAAKDKLTTEKEDLDRKKEKVEAIATGLTTINISKNENKYYTPNGQRTSHTTKGIVLMNGKKVLVK